MIELEPMKKLLVLLAACADPTTTAEVLHLPPPPPPPLDCPPVHSSVPLTTGQVITTGLRSIMIDNGLVRLRYGAHQMDFRDQGVTLENSDRHADHVMAGRHTDDPSVTPSCESAACHSGGSHWHDVHNPWYGDGTRITSTGPTRDADELRVLRSDEDAIELAYYWHAIPLDGLKSPGVCAQGVYPECGPTSRDHLSYPVYYPMTNLIKSIHTADIYKTIRVDRCRKGYYVSYRTDPPTSQPDQGPHTLRLSYLSAQTVWPCGAPAQAVRHPDVGTHATFSSTNCLAVVEAPLTGHDGWPFVTVLQTLRPVQMSSLQYSPGQLGSPGASDIPDAIGVDGRPEAWQAFVGATEYASSNPASEPTATAQALAAGL